VPVALRGEDSRGFGGRRNFPVGTIGAAPWLYCSVEQPSRQLTVMLQRERRGAEPLRFNATNAPS